MNHWINKRKKKSQIVFGSVVKRISTGTLMTVVAIFTVGTPWGVRNEYLCQWFVGNKLFTDTFLRNSIELEH